MGLWDAILDFFGSTRQPSPKPVIPSRKSTTRRTRWATPSESKHRYASDLKTYTGTITYVDDKFVKVERFKEGFEYLEGVIFIRELSPSSVYLESASQVVEEGNEIDFAILEPSEKKPGEYILSAAIVPEIRVRRALRRIEPGTRRNAVVKDVRWDRVHFQAGTVVTGVIFREELAHEHVESCLDVVSVGEKFEVEVLEKIEPEGWVKDKRMRNAHVRASRARCLPRRRGKRVRLPLSGLPFSVEVRLNLPRHFDPVVEFVFRGLAEDRSRDDLAKCSSLPTSTINEICGVLAGLGLLDSRSNPTGKGKEVNDALGRIAKFAKSPIEGLFVSAAPRGKAFHPISAAANDAWPAGHPPPPFNAQHQDSFLRATREELPRLPFVDMLDEEGTQQLQAAIDDRYLRVFLRRTRGRPLRIPVVVDIPDTWILGALWHCLAPAQKKPPFRPKNNTDFASAVRLVKLQVSCEGGTGEPVWWEPATNTLWRLRTQEQEPRLVENRATALPEVAANLMRRIDLPPGRHGKVAPTCWNTLVVPRGR